MLMFHRRPGAHEALGILRARGRHAAVRRREDGLTHAAPSAEAVGCGLWAVGCAGSIIYFLI